MIKHLLDDAKSDYFHREESAYSLNRFIEDQQPLKKARIPSPEGKVEYRLYLQDLQALMSKRERLVLNAFLQNYNDNEIIQTLTISTEELMEIKRSIRRIWCLYDEDIAEKHENKSNFP